ncbi:MAG: VanW family protein [Clostridia bacterium]
MDEYIKDPSLPQQNSQQINSHIVKYGLIYFFIIFIISSMLISIGAYNILNYEKVYAGIYIDDLYVGGETKESVLDKLMQEYQSVLDQRQIKISSKGESIDIQYKALDAKYNIEDAVLKALDVGRKGNFIERLVTISRIKKNNVLIPLTVHINSVKAQKMVKELANKIDISVRENSTSIMGDRLIIKSGVRGEAINISGAVAKITEAVQDKNVKILEIEPEIVYPKTISVEELFKQVYSEPVNADYEVKDYRIYLKEHKAGITFDKAAAERVITNIDEEGKEYSIPLIVTQPDFNKQALEEILFRDKLSSYTTTYDVNQIERSNNVVLAAEKINGVVLGPGDVFSYNDVVGIRAEETGFQNAKIYENGRVVDGIGGGICQVSSTLYNAVLYSDLDVLNRVNHSMTVVYVPMGQDATVVYGLIDFKFKNNTSWPIRISSVINKGILKMDVLGTNEDQEKTIEIQNQIIQTIPFTTKIVDDPTLEEGKIFIEQKGGNGYVVDTYKLTKIEDKIVKKELITKSRYTPLERIERKGTKKIILEPEKEQKQAVESTQEKPSEPVVPAAQTEADPTPEPI